MGHRGENTGPVRRRFNLRKSREKLEGLLAANFPNGAQLVTLTYGPETRAPSVKLADLQLLDWVKQARKVIGHNTKYIRATAHDKSHCGYHVHRVILDVSEASVASLLPLWRYGDATAEPIAENDLEPLTVLLMAPAIREGRVVAPCKRTWSPSAGMIRPERKKRK